MVKRKNPRHGSMQFWPRVRARKNYARIRSFPSSTEPKLLGFAGYKAGMTHVVAIDNQKNSLTKGEQVSFPVTVIECPPLRISSIRCYEPCGYGMKIAKELFFKPSKEFSRKAPVAKQFSSPSDIDSLDPSHYCKITVQVYTQPRLTGIAKKTPEIFELDVGGTVADQISFIKEHINKDIALKDVFTQGSYVDVRTVSKGKGYQGPVKRFGVGLRPRKSEKTKRAPGSLGAWIAQGHTMYRIAFAGQTGFHQRTQYSNYIVDIFDDPSKINPKGGFINYGEVKTSYLLIKGSVPGPKKRLITLTMPLRKTKQIAPPTLLTIATDSKQGN